MRKLGCDLKGDFSVQRMGIFGGSFDPIHEGHLRIALCALDQLKLDQVLFVPTARSPFKQEKTHSVSDRDRLAMVRLAVQDIPEFKVSTWELEQGGVSYTVDTLRYFEREYPDHDFFLLMGEDTYDGLARWKNSTEIFQRAHVVVAPRAATEKSRTARKHEEPIQKPQYLIMPLCDASSTQLRIDLGQKREAALSRLPEAVQRYIRAQDLYT